MNSSISSSDASASAAPPRGAAWKIMVFLVGVFVLLEIFTRWYFYPMFWDLGRLAEYPARADRLRRQPGLRVAFLGNSAIYGALDPVILEARLPRVVCKPVPFELLWAE